MTKATIKIDYEYDERNLRLDEEKFKSDIEITRNGVKSSASNIVDLASASAAFTLALAAHCLAVDSDIKGATKVLNKISANAQQIIIDQGEI